jgi:outer membrane biosynthesis protein TonB
VTIGNFAGTVAVAVLILLIRAGDDRREAARPASSAVVLETTRPETTRAEPAPTREVEPPRTSETAPPRPKPPHVAAPAIPEPPTAAPKLPAVAAGPPAPRQNEPPQAEPVPEQSPPAQKSPARPETTPPPSTETAPPSETAAPQPAKPTGVTLDLTALEQRLRDTKAIGVFTKLSLKNQVDDLLDEFREFHRSREQTMLAKLRQAFDLLVLKVLSLLQDGDPPLARDVLSSREALWNILTDPDKFKNL